MTPSESWKGSLSVAGHTDRCSVNGFRPALCTVRRLRPAFHVSRVSIGASRSARPWCHDEYCGPVLRDASQGMRSTCPASLPSGGLSLLHNFVLFICPSSDNLESGAYRKL